MLLRVFPFVACCFSHVSNHIIQCGLYQILPEDKWYRVAHVTKSPYHGGSFEGNECRRLVTAGNAADWSGCGTLLSYRARALFVALDTLYKVVFSVRLQLTDDDVEEVALVVQEFVDLWTSLAPTLQLGSPLKLHVLAVHVPEFCSLYRCTPAAYGEQDGESAHRRFASLMDVFLNLGERALAHTVKVFNASRF